MPSSASYLQAEYFMGSQAGYFTGSILHQRAGLVYIAKRWPFW
jgi:hypothetical protein